MMIACAALLGLKVNFLDFVALPITLGISVDYAVNVVARDDGPAERGSSDRSADLGQALATTGGAVVLCSWTTIVGYGSLLLSANAGIRSFGAVAHPRRGDLLARGADAGARAAGVDGAARSEPRVRTPGVELTASRTVQASIPASRCNWAESNRSRKLVAKEGNNPTGAALRGADQ